jgi:oligopeptide/dipeptide ABC transporter ATP-binding protein
MIFQEPMSALNPVMRIGDQVAESLILHDKVGKKEAAQAVRKMLLRVGLSEEKAQGRSYPHELSGGERQRVMIAMALICKPKLIIADEPTTALDASLQTQILELLSSLQKETGVSVLFITHDLGLVKRFCQKVYVMYAGVVVETGRTRDIFEFPRHPYTRALLDSRPGDNILPKTPLRSIEGRLPTFWEWESGCRFAPRCPFAKSVCKKPQELLPTHTTHARCCRWSEIAAADGARAEEKPLLPTCFCFLVRKKAGKITDICLGFKKRGFAEGKWLSLGGKISAGETADQAVRREALEEAGVTLDKIHAAGTLTFKFMNNDGWSHRASVYLCDDWTGEIRESEEIIPRWYPVDQIPYHEMWPDNKIWLPLLLKGKTVNGNLVYSDEQTLVEHQVESGEWL